MKKYLLLFVLLPVFSFGQQQIGQTINHITAGDGTGRGIAISEDGKIVAIGSPRNDANGIKDSGTVRVFQNVSGTWTQVGQDINGTILNAHLGSSVCLSADGKTLATAIIDLNNPNRSFIQVYQNQSGRWVQIGRNIISNGAGGSTDHREPIALSADGKVLAVGEPTMGGNTNYPGRVRVFQNISGTWTQVGQDIGNQIAGYRNGYTVALHPNGNVVAFISYPVSSSNEYISVYYRNANGNWIQLGNEFHIPRDPVRSPHFGRLLSSISLSSVNDNILLAIGSPHAENNSDIYSIGNVQVYEYEYIPGAWTQVGQNITAPYPYGMFGNRVSLSYDGKRIAVYDPNAIITNKLNDGFVQVYENQSGSWTQIGRNITSPGKERTGFMAFSGDGNTIAVGFDEIFLNASPDYYVRVFDMTKPSSSSEFVMNSFNMYPNPAKELLNISLENDLLLEKAVLYNTLGQIVKQTNEKTINVSALPNGLYFVEVTTNQGKAVKKVIVE